MGYQPLDCAAIELDDAPTDSGSTAAAIDRLVHHSVILELNISSYRLEQAKQAKAAAAGKGEP